MKRAVFIDAAARLIYEGQADLEVAQKFLNGYLERAFEFTGEGDQQVVLYVDEEAKIKPNRPKSGFVINGLEVLGNGIFLAHDRASGDSIDVPDAINPQSIKVEWTSQAPSISPPLLQHPPSTFWFRQMVNCVRDSGIRLTRDCEEIFTQDRVTQFFWEILPSTEIFVFSSGKGTEPVTDKLIENTKYSDDLLDLPFKTASFELGGGKYLLNIQEKNAGMACVLVHELDASKYLYYILTMLNGSPVVTFDHSHVDPDYIGKLVRYYLERLRNEKDGVEKTSQSVRIPSPNPKKRKFHEIRRIFHVRPRNRLSAPYDGESGRNVSIEWTHRFSVRGHWVRFWLDRETGTLDKTRLGKNRDGEYVEYGRTWRKAHERGPEDQPVVKKIRLVKDDHEEY